MVDGESTDKGIKVIFRRNGRSCIKDSANSECLHDEVNTEDLLSEDAYRGFWVQTKLTSEGHMKVTGNWSNFVLLLNLGQHFFVLQKRSIYVGGERGQRKGVSAFYGSCGWGVEGETRTTNVSGSLGPLCGQGEKVVKVMSGHSLCHVFIPYS